MVISIKANPRKETGEMDKTDAETRKAPGTEVKNKNTEGAAESATIKAESKPEKTSGAKKAFYQTWQFWVVIGAFAVAILVALAIIIPMLGNNNNIDGQGGATNNGSWIASCQNGNKDMISGGRWVVGKDIASGDYKLTAGDGYSYIYIYDSEDASEYDYLESVTVPEEGVFVHLDNGQVVEVNYDTIDMVCQDFGDIELISVGKTMKAGNYTLVATDDYTYAYVYADSDYSKYDYDAYVSFDGLGDKKSYRFKDGQYLSISSGGIFVIDMTQADAEDLVVEAVKLAKSVSSDSDKDTDAGSSSTSSTSTSSPSSSSSSNPSSSTSSSSSSSNTSSSSSSSSSSGSVSWKQLLKEYEDWVDDYVEFMKKYKDADSSDLASMLSDYYALLADMTAWSEKVDNMKDDLTGSDLTDYISELSRITQKLNDAM